MKRIFTLVLIGLLLLNVLGYYVVYVGLMYRNSQVMIQNLDADNYNKSEAVLLKVPFALPYGSDSRDFERVDGQFEYHGEFYRIVKQRILRDTLQVVLIKDIQQKQINEALVDFVETFSENSSTEPGQDSKSRTNHPIKDFISLTIVVEQSSSGWVGDVRKESRPLVLTPFYCPSIVHPPERA